MDAKSNKGYGAVDSTECDEAEFVSTTYKAISIDSMNDAITFQINEQTNSDKNAGKTFRAKFNFSNPQWPGTSKMRRKSDTDLLLLTSNIRERENIYSREAFEPFYHQKEKATVFSRQQKLVLATIALTDFVSYGAISIMAPFFPNEASKKGVNTAFAGLVFSFYSLAMFVGSGYMGGITDKIGPKVLLLSGIGLAGICNILFGLLHYITETVPYYMSCIIVRGLEGLGAAAFSTAGFTFTAEIFPDQLGSVMGWLEIAVGLGMTCGPAIGGFLYEWGGYGLPFYFVGGILLILLPIHLMILPPIVSTTPTEGSSWALLSYKPALMVGLVIVVCSIVWAFPDPTLEPHLREFNLKASYLGLFFMLFAGTYALSSPLFGYMADKVKRKWILMFFGLVFTAAGVLLLGPAGITGLSNSIWLNLLAIAILGASTSMTLLPTFEALLDYAIASGCSDGIATYALVGGLWSSLYSLGDVIGPTSGSFLTHHFGFPVCTSVMAVPCIITALIILIYFGIFHEDEDSSETNA